MQDQDPMLAWMDFCHGHYSRKTQRRDDWTGPYPEITHA